MNYKKPIYADAVIDIAKRDAVGASDSSAVVMCKSSTFKDWWQEHGSIDYDEMCQANAAWNGALEQVIPRLR